MNHRAANPNKLAGMLFLLAVLMVAVPQTAQGNCSYCGNIPCEVTEHSETEIIEKTLQTCTTGSDGITRCVTITTYTELQAFQPAVGPKGRGWAAEVS